MNIEKILAIRQHYTEDPHSLPADKPSRRPTSADILELCDLASRLAAAEKVVEVARTFRARCPRHPFQDGHIPCTCGRQELDAALAAYPPKPASGTEHGQRGGE